MNTRPAIAAVDWGTTRLRAWLLAGDGKVLAEQRGDDGLITAREAGFSNVLERHLAAMDAPATLPVVICGMAGSRQGWIEAAYVDVPAPINAILQGAIRVPDTARDVRIVPGLAQRLADAPDVMRGEETQLAGANLTADGQHLVCMPGTHSKWVVVEDGAVTGFGTWPTGELFSVLATHSILRHSLGEQVAAVAAGNDGFRYWCRQAFQDGGDVSSRLFAIRAAGLLRGLHPNEAVAVADAIYRAGIEAIEVPLNSPDPFTSIASIVKALPHSALIGAGTVLTAEDVDALKRAEGRLLVSPNIDADVMHRAAHHGLVTMPGVFTPTEAFQAIRLGASALKFFPASVLGSSGIAAMRAVLPSDTLVGAVGGVSEKDFAGYKTAGVTVFGLGSSLFKPGMTVADVTARAEAAVAVWDQVFGEQK